MNIYEIHIGNLIREKLNEDGRSITWLAKKLHFERANIYRLLQKPFIDTYLLLRISKILEHDFFAYYSKCLQKQTNLFDFE